MPSSNNKETNLLAEVACPECGGQERFTVGANSTFVVTARWARLQGGFEAAQIREAVCADCGFTGPWKLFRETPGSNGVRVPAMDENHRLVANRQRSIAIPADPWLSDPDYPREDWRYDVSNGDTNAGYWEWVACQRQVDEDR